MSSQPLEIKKHLADLLQSALASVAPGTEADIVIERPRDPSHGDFASNLAMQLARELKENPRQIAERLVHELPRSAWVLKAEVAGAGFINFRLVAAAKTQVVKVVLAQGQTTASGARQPAEGAGRVRLGQSDRPAACRPRSRRGLRREPGLPADLRRQRRRARVST